MSKQNEPAYRLEPMGDQPTELMDAGFLSPGLEWCIVRCHDDEPMSVYSSKEEAESALSAMLTERAKGEANCRPVPEVAYNQALDDAVGAVMDLKPIKSWESDGEKFTDCWISIHKDTQQAAISAINALRKHPAHAG